MDDILKCFYLLVLIKSDLHYFLRINQISTKQFYW